MSAISPHCDLHKVLLRCSFAGLLLFPAGAVAQIALDGATPTTIDQTGSSITIEGGLFAGANQFHSFEEFGVHIDETVTFSSTMAGVENVISRVTGETASAIEGALRVSQADANFYLINPNGVVIGPAATIDVPGAFHASTADRLIMSDGTSWSTQLSSGSAISFSAPASFGFPTGGAGVLRVDGALVTGDGAHLSGRQIDIDGASISANAGSISVRIIGGAGEIDVVAAPGAVEPIGGTLSLSGADLAAPGGVFISSGAVEIDQGATVFAMAATGTAVAGDIRIEATETIDVDQAQFRSFLSAGAPTTSDLTILIVNPDTGAIDQTRGAISLSDATLVNENLGAVEIVGRDVRISDMMTNRVAVRAENFTHSGRTDFVDGRTADDLQIRVDASNSEIGGQIVLSADDCLTTMCFGEDPELQVFGGDIVFRGEIRFDTLRFRRDDARPAVVFDGDQVSLTEQSALPDGSFVSSSVILIRSADGLRVVGDDVSVRNAVVGHNTANLLGDAYGVAFVAKTGEISVDGSSFSVNVGATSTCVGGVSGCDGDGALQAGSLVFSGVGDVTLNDANITHSTFSATAAADVEIASRDGDVRIDNLVTTTSSQAGLNDNLDQFEGDGSLGSFSIEAAGEVDINDLFLLALGAEPSPEEPGYALGNVDIGGQAIAMRNSLIAIGSDSFGSFEFRPTPNPALLDFPAAAPAGSVTLRAANDIIVERTRVSTSGAPSDDVVPNEGRISVIAGDSITLRDSTLETDISTLGAAGDILLRANDILIEDQLENVAETALTTTAVANSANAGGVTIVAPGRLSVSTASLSSDAETAAGAIDIDGGDITIADSQISATTSIGASSGGVVSIEAGQLRLIDTNVSTQVESGAIGGGGVQVRADSFYLTGGLITTEAASGAAGDIAVTGLLSSPIVLSESEVTTTSNDGRNVTGVIAIGRNDLGRTDGVVLLGSQIRALGGDIAALYVIDQERLVLDTDSSVLVGRLSDPFQLVGAQPGNTERRAIDDPFANVFASGLCAPIDWRGHSVLRYDPSLGLNLAFGKHLDRWFDAYAPVLYGTSAYAPKAVAAADAEGCHFP